MGISRETLVVLAKSGRSRRVSNQREREEKREVVGGSEVWTSKVRKVVEVGSAGTGRFEEGKTEQEEEEKTHLSPAPISRKRLRSTR
jgi:hypothetical protein